MSAGVNAGIVRAHRDGVLTNASLMVTAPGFDEAVALARATPTLGVGLHLVLVQGRAALPPAQIPLLADRDGMFRDDAVAAGLRYFVTPGVRTQLRLEIAAQLERFRSTGLTLSHVDGHLNIHMHPAVLGILLNLAPELGIRAVRTPVEPLGAAVRFDHGHLWRKFFEGTAFTLLARYARPRLAAAGIAFPDRVFGLHQTGRVTEAYLLHVLATLPPGTTEIYCHAGEADDESRRQRPPGYDPAAEMAALLSPTVREAIARSDVELLSYRALASS